MGKKVVKINFRDKMFLLTTLTFQNFQEKCISNLLQCKVQLNCYCYFIDSGQRYICCHHCKHRINKSNIFTKKIIKEIEKVKSQLNKLRTRKKIKRVNFILDNIFS